MPLRERFAQPDTGLIAGIAAYVKDSPVKPEDISATMLHAFGFAPEAEIRHPTGRPVRSSGGRAVRDLFI